MIKKYTNAIINKAPHLGKALQCLWTWVLEGLQLASYWGVGGCTGAWKEGCLNSD